MHVALLRPAWQGILQARIFASGFGVSFAADHGSICYLSELHRPNQEPDACV